MAIDKDAVVRLLSEKTYRPLTLPELEARLSLSDEDKPALAEAIDELIHSGQIIALRGQRYGIPQRMNLITGILQAHPNGYAFLIPDKPGERAADVFIGRNDLADAMHGDKVVVRVERTGRVGRPEGRVIRVLERRVKRIVGEYQQGTGFGYVVPEEGRHLHHIYIPKGREKRAYPGQIVVAEIRQYPEGNRDPEGEIVRVLGRRDDPDVEREVIIEKYGLSGRFPNDVLTEAKAVPQQVPASEYGLRVDLRALKTVTIDGEHARDFDDAVAIARLPDGRYRLWVSIADVAHYVKPGSQLDREARARATSVYFTDCVIPMLPEELSNGICSLNPHVERLTMTAELDFDAEGKLLRSQFYDSIIVSKERLTYTQVKQMLVDRDEDVLGRFRYLEEDLRTMEELALKLKGRREERGSLDVDLPEPFLLLDLEGNVEAILKSERNIAHRMIEEFMIAANEAVAAFLIREGAPALFRCHDEPEPAKIEDLRYFLQNLNLRLDQRVTPKALQRLLRVVSGRPLEKLVNEVVLRTMKHAYYSPRNAGHFGLASDQYLHFTSPIRRYPDLVVHRILKAVLERGGLSERQREALQVELNAVAPHCSERERNAERAEREALALKKVQFMRRYLGEEFEGYISGVTSFGFFVELKDLFVDGLVHISSLGDDYYEFRDRDQELVGQYTGRSFRLADRVVVKVARVDVEKRHIDFQLVTEVQREPVLMPPPAIRTGRPIPQVALEPAHPEMGDGRGRMRRQQVVPRGMPVRTPRPEDYEEERRRGRRGRREPGERVPELETEVSASVVAGPQPDLEASPPLSPEAATVPPPIVEEFESPIEAPLVTQGEEVRRKRRRRGGRGRKRRSESATEAVGMPVTPPAPSLESPGRTEVPTLPEPSQLETGLSDTSLAEVVPPSDAPKSGPSEGREADVDEAAEAVDSVGSVSPHEGEPAFVAKRRRRRRGGRGRRHRSGEARNSATETATQETPPARTQGEGEGGQ